MPGLACALTALLLALAAPAAAQEDDRIPSSEQVLDWLAGAESAMADGDFDAAYEFLRAANDATFTYDDYDALVKHYPNLVFARYHRLLEDWSEVSRFAASVASALDTDEHAAHAYRIEAILYQGAAFYQLGQGIEAERPLITAFRATEGKPELADLHAFASYYIARLSTDFDTPDAKVYRDHFLALDLDGSMVTVEQTAYIVYQDMFDRRTRGENLGPVIEQAEDLIEIIDGIDGFNAIDRSFYSGFLGLLYAEDGRHEEARAVFRERHEFLLANNGPFDSDFYWNIQRLAMLTSLMGDDAAARDFLRAELDEARQRQGDPYMLAYFNRNLAYYSENLGQKATAQLYYRAAYAELRRIRRSNDPEVLEIRKSIDLTARDIRSFSFAEELGIIGDVAFDWRPDASDAMRLFFEGRYVVLGAILDARAAEGGESDVLYLVNRAMQQALTSDYDGCMATLATARRRVVRDPGGPISLRDPIFDLIDAIAKVWSAGNARDQTVAAMARVEARMDRLPPSQRSLYLALEMFSAFQQGEHGRIPALFDAWADDWEQIGTKDIWAIYSATVALEGAMGMADPERIAEQRDAAFRAIEAQETITLARDYLRITTYLNGKDAIYGEEALTELGVLVREVSLRVPESHGMVSAGQYAMANAMRWRGRNADALEWLQEATRTIRNNPYQSNDTLAFLVSEQALLYALTGNKDIAAILAKEAYDMIDIRLARQDLAAAVVETYAYTVWQRTDNADRAAVIYRRHIDDAEFFDRLAPLHQARLLKAYADALSSSDDIALVRKLIDRAQSVLIDDLNDLRSDRSSIIWTLAIAEYYAGEYAVAFDRMVASNEMMKEWSDEQVARGAISNLGADGAHMRAAWEAAIGWTYAQTLPE